MPCVSRLPRSQSKVTFQAQPSGEPEAPELSTVKPSTPARRPCSGCWASPCPRAHQCAPADPSRGAQGPVAVRAGEAQGRTPACPSQHALSPGLPVRPCAPETPAPSSTEPPVQGQPPPWDPFRDGKEGTGSSALAAAWPAPGPGLLLGAPPWLAGRFPHLPECPLPSPTSAASPRGPCPSSAGTSHSDAASPGPLLTLLGREVHLQTAGGHTGTSLRPTACGLWSHVSTGFFSHGGCGQGRGGHSDSEASCSGSQRCHAGRWGGLLAALTLSPLPPSPGPARRGPGGAGRRDASAGFSVPSAGVAGTEQQTVKDDVTSASKLGNPRLWGEQGTRAGLTEGSGASGTGGARRDNEEGVATRLSALLWRSPAHRPVAKGQDCSGRRCA
ncbi:uncharacterized protein [Canis lupus baileyi]|uniref:uncharacterized protein n=1 Tax=Canis lupus baileyi TaxID=143281 RepID=UPI003B973512